MAVNLIDKAANALEKAKVALKQGVKPALATPGESLWAMTDLSVNGGNIMDLSLSLQKGMSISSSVVFDGGNTASLDFTKMRVTLAPAPDASSPAFGEGQPISEAALDSSGRFTIRGVMPGKYRVVPSRGFPPALTIESSTLQDATSLDIPLEYPSGRKIRVAVCSRSAWPRLS